MKCSCDTSGNAPRPCYDVTWCVTRIDPKVHVTFLEVTWMQSKLNLHYRFSPLTFTMNFSEVNKKDGGSVRFSPLKFTLLPGRQTQTRKQEWKFWRGYLHGHFDYGGNQGFLWTYASSFLNLWISISMVSCMSCTSQQWCKGAWPWVWGILPEIPLPSSSSSPASP